MIAEVIIDSNVKKLNRKFDYKVPIELEDLVDVGSRVLVPFGNKKTLEQGYIIALKETTEFEVKEIAGLEENLPEERINLARKMARKYFCNVSECIKLMLTPGTKNKVKSKQITNKNIELLYLNRPYEEINEKEIRGAKQKKLLEFLKLNQGLSIPDIETITEVNRNTINTLIKRGILKIEEKQIDRNPLIHKKINENKKLELNDEQDFAYKKIEKAINENRFQEFLLYGITGSRKNRDIFTTNRKNN